MLMTGLVSLNVHEALTFEGTEICLHPDIFSSNAGDGASYAPTVSGSARHSVMSASKDGRMALAQASSMEESAASQSKILQVGDMVEVRVWDLLPRSQQQASSSASSVLRKPQSQPASEQSSTSGSHTEERGHPLVAGSNEALEAAAASLSSSLKSAQTAPARGGAQASLQYSESAASPQLEGYADKPIEESTSREMDALTVTSEDLPSMHNQEAITPLHSPGPPGPLSPGDDNVLSRTVVTSGVLPPVFPRSRTNTAEGFFPRSRTSTADGAGGAGGATFRLPKTTKPPIAQRPRMMSAQASLDPYKPRQSSTTPGSLAKPRHQRELSDMTVDTYYGGDPPKAVILENSLSVVDLQLPLPTFDDEDDVWTHISSTHALRLSFVMKVTEKSLTSLKGSARTQVSLLRPVADL
jgi:hypothetical protein